MMKQKRIMYDESKERSDYSEEIKKDFSSIPFNLMITLNWNKLIIGLPFIDIIKGMIYSQNPNPLSKGLIKSHSFFFSSSSIFLFLFYSFIPLYVNMIILIHWESF